MLCVTYIYPALGLYHYPVIVPCLYPTMCTCTYPDIHYTINSLPLLYPHLLISTIIEPTSQKAICR